MARSANKAGSLFAWLRARKRRATAIGLLAGLLLAQTALVVHGIDHANAGHRVSCALCVAADHSPAPASEPLRPFVPQRPALVAFVAVESAPIVLILSYRSRAPPQHLQS